LLSIFIFMPRGPRTRSWHHAKTLAPVLLIRARRPRELVLSQRVGIMVTASIKAKFDEAQSALSRMRDRQDRAFGDNEAQFDHDLSAFVGACRSVVLQLERNFASIYPDWRKAWNVQHRDEDGILKAMHDRRDDNVHEGKALGHINRPEQIKVGSGSSYSDKSGRLENFSCPGPLLEADLSVTVHKPRYFFGDKPVLEACEEYLGVLQRMVAEFESYLNSQVTAAARP
jgi:hypothetical protein